MSPFGDLPSGQSAAAFRAGEGETLPGLTGLESGAGRLDEDTQRVQVLEAIRSSDEGELAQKVRDPAKRGRLDEVAGDIQARLERGLPLVDDTLVQTDEGVRSAQRRGSSFELPGRTVSQETARDARPGGSVELQVQSTGEGTGSTLPGLGGLLGAGAAGLVAVVGILVAIVAAVRGGDD